MGNKLIDICNKYNLVIQNNGSHTRYENGQKSSPDLTLTRGMPNLQWLIDNNINLNSDHLPILISLRVNHKVVSEKWNLKDTNWQEWKRKTNEVFQDFKTKISDMSTEDICNSFEEQVANTAKNVIPKKKICQHSKAHMNDDLKLLLKNVKEAKKKYERRADPNNYRLYKAALTEFISQYNDARDKNFKELCENLDPKDNQVWAKINNQISGQTEHIVQPLKDEQGVIHFEDCEISDILTKAHIEKNLHQTDFDKEWYNHVEINVAQYNTSERHSVNENNSEIDLPGHNKNISVTEVNWAVSKLRTFSAPGPDGILPIMVKKAGSNLHNALQVLVQSCWSTGDLPSQWKKENRIP